MLQDVFDCAPGLSAVVSLDAVAEEEVVWVMCLKLEDQEKYNGGQAA